MPCRMRQAAAGVARLFAGLQEKRQGGWEGGSGAVWSVLLNYAKVARFQCRFGSTPKDLEISLILSYLSVSKVIAQETGAARHLA